MARWSLCWLLVILTATMLVYAGTNRLIASNAYGNASYAMLPLGQLGSESCTQAGRALIAAGDGNQPNAPAAQRAAYDQAAAAVLAACGTA